jgi:hypothetical protein
MVMNLYNSLLKYYAKEVQKLKKEVTISELPPQAFFGSPCISQNPSKSHIELAEIKTPSLR